MIASSILKKTKVLPIPQKKLFHLNAFSVQTLQDTGINWRRKYKHGSASIARTIN
jgi:hypothetical protein